MRGTSDFQFTLEAQHTLLKHTMYNFLSMYAYLFVFFSVIIYKRLGQVMKWMHVFHAVRKTAWIKWLIVQDVNHLFWIFPHHVIQVR